MRNVTDSRYRGFLACLFCLLLWGLALRVAGAQTPGSAATSAASDDDLQEVVVIGRYEFLSADTSGATNLPLPIEKVPQSISLVSEGFIKAADLRSLGEIAQYTSGALNVGDSEGFGTSVKIRGFESLTAFDGLNVGVLSGSTYEPDYAIIDRLEIVKGPSSVMYGVSSAGGLVNFVTKSATADTPDYVSLQYGSWNSTRLEGQVAGALTPAGTLRAIGVAVYDRGNSFITDVDHSSVVVYGGLNWQGTDSVTAFLHGGYERHLRTSIDGVPTEADGTPARLPRSFLIGSPDMQLRSEVWHTEANVSWHVNDLLDLSLKGNLRRVTNRGVSPYSFGLEEDGTLGLAIQDFSAGIHDNDFAVGLSGILHFDALGLANSFLSLSAMYQDARSIGAGGQAIFTGRFASPDPDTPVLGVVNIREGQAAVEEAFNTAILTGPQTFYEIQSKTLTLSAQSWIRIIDRLSLLAGASFAKPHVSSETDGVLQHFDSGNQMSYRGGLVYEFPKDINAYLSYSQSFNPQTTIDVNGAVLPPIIGKQYETGVKYRPAGGRLLLSAALFHILQRNQGEFDTQIDGLDRYAPVGELTHKGVELEAVGRLRPNWQINAGYAYLDAKVTESSDVTVVGKREVFLPRQTASLFSTFTLDKGPLKGLSFGAGVRYVGAEPTAYDGSTREIPGYALVDASAGYGNAGWTIQLNAHNLFSRHYYINNYNTLFYGNMVGEPFNVALSIRRDF